MSRILLVDDDDVFRQRLAQALSTRGHEVRTCAGMPETQATVRTWKPERAIIDLRMEGGPSGLDVLGWLVSEVEGVRAVILTGFGSIATTVEAMRLGACNYVAKPAQVSEILGAFEVETARSARAPETPLSLARIEWEIINRTLLECEGNISETARRLGLHRRTLQRRLAKFPPEDGDPSE